MLNAKCLKNVVTRLKPTKLEPTHLDTKRLDGAKGIYVVCLYPTEVAIQ